MKRWGTPLGHFDVELGNDGVSSVLIGDGRADGDVAPELARALDEHMKGRPAALKLDLQSVTPIAQITLAKLLEIPYGEVRSYAWVAREIGKPTAIRAVASAVAQNPLPVLIPCHRVVRSDGHIGEFSFGGPDMKHKLLQFEGLDTSYLDDLAKRRVRVLGDSDEKIFHVPSCHLAPLPKSAALVEFPNASSATDERYSPCRRCRPVAIFS